MRASKPSRIIHELTKMALTRYINSRLQELAARMPALEENMQELMASGDMDRFNSERVVRLRTFARAEELRDIATYFGCNVAIPDGLGI